MKTLLVMRHAKSSWHNANLDDHDRPLNHRGKQDAPRMGHWLREQQLVPERIVTSTAKRARSTAKAVAKTCGFAGEVLRDSTLYLAEPDAYLPVFRNSPENCECVMVVGHNPGVEGLVECLTENYTRMPTAAIARIELSLDTWHNLDDTTVGRLVQTCCPKELPGE